MEQSLSGIKVLDLTHYIAGPYCTKMQADCGAEVVKVEAPGQGDPARKCGPFPNDEPHAEKSLLFLYLNASKKSITLNLETETGAKIFKELVKKSDALIEDYAPGSMQSLGLGYETLEPLNPGLVMTSLTSFGQAGPYRDYKATDIVQQAIGGWMYSGGQPGRQPLKGPAFLSHYVAGLFALVATMTALHHRNRTGTGQHVDVSAIEGFLLAYLSFTAYSFWGQVIPRTGSPYPYTILPCKDGYIGVNILTQGQWELLCQFMGMPELIDDPRFVDGFRRAEHRDEITALLTRWLEDKEKDYLFHEGQSWRIPFCLIPNTEEILRQEQHRQREYFVKVQHPLAGELTQPGAPFKMGRTPWRMASLAPLLGEHNREVYGGWLGFSHQDLIQLRQAGIV